MRIAHPAVVKISAARGKLFDEFFHALPCRGAKPFRFLPASGDKDLPLAYVAGVLEGIFVFLHQVVIMRLAHDDYFAIKHF